MSRKMKLLGTLHVVGALILSYVAQVSHVSSEIVAKWTLHDWTYASLLVTYAGISAWKAFIVNPHAIAAEPLPPTSSKSVPPRGVSPAVEPGPTPASATAPTVNPH